MGRRGSDNGTLLKQSLSATVATFPKISLAPPSVKGEMKEMARILGNMEPEFWDKREKALKRLGGIIAGESVDPAEIGQHLKDLRKPLAAQLEDLRSQIVRTGCAVTMLAAQLVPSFGDVFVAWLIPALFKNLCVKAAPIREPSHECIQFVITQRPDAKLIAPLCLLAGDKDNMKRGRAAEYLLIVSAWDDKLLAKDLILLVTTIVKLTSDKSNDVRRDAREAVAQLGSRFPQEMALTVFELQKKGGKLVEGLLSDEVRDELVKVEREPGIYRRKTLAPKNMARQSQRYSDASSEGPAKRGKRDDDDEEDLSMDEDDDDDDEDDDEYDTGRGGATEAVYQCYDTKPAGGPKKLNKRAQSFGSALPSVTAHRESSKPATRIIRPPGPNALRSQRSMSMGNGLTRNKASRKSTGMLPSKEFMEARRMPRANSREQLAGSGNTRTIMRPTATSRASAAATMVPSTTNNKASWNASSRNSKRMTMPAGGIKSAMRNGHFSGSLGSLGCMDESIPKRNSRRASRASTSSISSGASLPRQPAAANNPHDRTESQIARHRRVGSTDSSVSEATTAYSYAPPPADSDVSDVGSQRGSEPGTLAKRVSRRSTGTALPSRMPPPRRVDRENAGSGNSMPDNLAEKRRSMKMSSGSMSRHSVGPVSANKAMARDQSTLGPLVSELAISAVKTVSRPADTQSIASSHAIDTNRSEPTLKHRLVGRTEKCVDDDF